MPSHAHALSYVHALSNAHALSYANALSYLHAVGALTYQCTVTVCATCVLQAEAKKANDDEADKKLQVSK